MSPRTWTVSLPGLSATLLRPGLLTGTSVLLAAAKPPSRYGEAVALRPTARAMIAAGVGGKLVLIAQPPSDAAVEAARAGVENRARYSGCAFDLGAAGATGTA